MLTALCHVGANIVPSGAHCEVFAEAAARGLARMMIGEQAAVSALWDAARRELPEVRGRPARAARLRDRGPAAARRHRAARCDPGRSRPSRCRRAPRRTSSSSGRTRSPATRRAFAGGRSLRSRRSARGCGSRTTSSCSRPRPRPGRRRPCSCSRSGSTRPRVGAATGSRPPRPVPAAARDDADGDAVRAAGEHAGDRALRCGRHAPRPRIQERALLKRLLRLAVAIWVLRWAAREYACYLSRRPAR